MDKRTTAIIATVVTALLCGCPGLAAICFGAFFAMVGSIPGADIDVFGSSDPQSAMTFGIVAACLGVLFVAIPIVVGFLTLRNKPAPAGARVIDQPVTPPTDPWASATPPAPPTPPTPPAQTPPDETILQTPPPPPDDSIPPAI